MSYMLYIVEKAAAVPSLGFLAIGDDIYPDHSHHGDNRKSDY